MAIHTAYSVRMNSRYAASTRSSARLPASDLNARSRRPLESFRTSPTPPPLPTTVLSAVWPGGKGRRQRSEEHTSELQSHVNLVCRLLLEKKKKKHNKLTDHRNKLR